MTSIFQLAIIFIGGIQGIETRFTYTCLGVYIEAGVDVYNTKYDSFVEDKYVPQGWIQCH